MRTCCFFVRVLDEFLMWYRELAKIDGVSLQEGSNASMVESDKKGFIFMDEDCLDNLIPYATEFAFYPLTTEEYRENSYIIKAMLTTPKIATTEMERKGEEIKARRWRGTPLDEKFWAEEWTHF